MELTPIPSPDLSDTEAGVTHAYHYESTLDRHVDDVLKRPSKLRRTMKGVRSFLKTRESLELFAFVVLTNLSTALGVCELSFFHIHMIHMILRADHRRYIRLLGRWVDFCNCDIFLLKVFVVFWGAAIVLFLTKIINLHNKDRQGYWVEISSQVVNGEASHSTRTAPKFQTGLFTITGVGLIPTRVLDTYRKS